MTETTNDQSLSVEHSSGPECYVRINVTKNTKGYSYETTASIRYDLDTCAGMDLLAVLLADSDEAARAEIVRRQREDEGQS